MEWYERYKPSLSHLFSEAEARIARFPTPLNTIGLAYADKFHPVRHETGKNYICTLLPYWLNSHSVITDEQCEQIALVNVYGMLHFFIQDDVMDGNSTANLKEQLALCHLLNLEMLRGLRELYPSDSPFWSYYEGYVTTWADCVVNEGHTNYFISDPMRTAGKAAPVKISSTGMCLLTNQIDQIACMEEAVDLVLMTLQMLDDWSDWRTDLAEESYNGLLAMIFANLSSQSPVKSGPLTIEEVQAAIYVRGCLKQFVHIAQINHDRLLTLELEIKELIDFHAYMVDCLYKVFESIESKKNALLGGGLNYFFSSTVPN